MESTSYNGAPIVTPLWQRCQEIAILLESSANIQFLITDFRRCVDEMLNFSSLQVQPLQNAVNLLLVESASMSDYRALFDLLCTRGAMFRAIDRLMVADPGLRYGISLTDLPIECRSALLSWRQFTSNSGFSNANESIVSPNIDLNPFQYFCTRFACHLIMAASICPNMLVERLDCVYATILVDYLQRFLSSDGLFAATDSPFPGHSGGNVSSSSSSSYRSTPDYSYRSIDEKKSSSSPQSAVRTSLGLLRRELLSNVSNSSIIDQNRSGGQLKSDASWRSADLLSILLHVWLTVPDRSIDGAEEIGCGNDLQFLSSSLGAPTSGAVVVMSRFLIKHLHRFVYSRVPIGMESSEMRDFKENHVTKLLDERVWLFLNYNFAKWPLDGSFRLILELWFSYVQPWRYVDQGSNDRTLTGDSWRPFIWKRRQFYRTFFVAALSRFLRVDLASSKNALALFRLSKVFSQSILLEELNWSGGVTDHSHKSNRSPSSSSSSSFIQKSSPFNRSDETRSADVRQFLLPVLKRALTAADQCRKTIDDIQTAESRRSWLERLFDFGDDNRFSVLEETAKIIDCLRSAVQLFELAFDVRVAENGVVNDTMESIANASSAPAAGSEWPVNNLLVKQPPDCQIDQNGTMRLSPVGRRQLLNRTRQLQFDRSKFPTDLVPVGDREHAWLANGLQKLSDQINHQYGTQFAAAYRRDGLVGRLAKLILEPPTSIVAKHNPVISRDQPDLPARLNLRFLATNRFLCGIFCVIVMCTLFLGVRSTICLIFAAAFFYSMAIGSLIYEFGF